MYLTFGLVLVIFSASTASDILFYFYLFNPLLDTMQKIRTYNSKTLNSKHANCKTSRQNTNRCLHY